MSNIRFWMSAEIQADVGDFYMAAQNAIEAALNQCTKENDYGEGLNLWAYIAIILEPRLSERYTEVKRYKKKKREVEFRLQINHEEFLKGDAKQHLRLVAESVLRSFELMREMKIKDLDLERLTHDVNQCLSIYLL